MFNGSNLHLMTIANSILSVVILYYSIYLIIRGRKEARSLMIVYAVAGLWAVSVHSMIMVDKLWKNIFDWQVTTTFLIRPLLFVLMSTILAGIIKSGWRYDR
jgi:hypothetical protein